MTETLHANIFFLIASVGVIVFTLLVSIILYHAIKVIRTIRRIVERIDAGSEAVVEDLTELRASLTPGRLFSLLMNLTGMGGGRRSRRRADDDDE